MTFNLLTWNRDRITERPRIQHRRPPVTEHEPAPPPTGWGDVLAQLAAAQRRVAELEAERDRRNGADLACTAPELRREVAQLRARLHAKEAQLERYRELDIARERAHGFGGFEGRTHKPAALEPGPYEVFPTTRPAASPITDRSQPDGTGEQPRTEVP